VKRKRIIPEQIIIYLQIIIMSNLPENDNKVDNDPSKYIPSMLEACSKGDLSAVQSILDRCKEQHNNAIAASLQDDKTGLSPLMIAAKCGHLELCQLLLEEGAPWNAIDRNGKCAGNYATDLEHWEVVNLLVDAGTKAELLLGASIRLSMEKNNGVLDDGKQIVKESSSDYKDDKKVPVENEPCTKPDYLKSNVRYNAANTLLLDDDDDAVMMQWEKPLMDAHASIMTGNGQKSKTVLNVGFGLGIIDTALQKYEPALHVIIEAHPVVYKKMVQDGWDSKPNVRICFGRWQEEMPKLIAEGVNFDGIFYDTYGEHFTDLEYFQALVAKSLQKPDGVYSFFNGLAPDNLFFHGVACQCVKLQLQQIGLDSEFAPCEIQVKEKEWDGVRRKYWHGRDTYYLPIITWNKDKLLLNKKNNGLDTRKENNEPSTSNNEIEGNGSCKKPKLN